MTHRLDVSAVPPQGGYIAKQCPVVIQNRILVPELEAPPLLEVQHWMQAGIDFEKRVVEALRTEGEGDWVVIPDIGRAEAQRLTKEALDSRKAVIEQAFLPYDSTGKRTGKPDLLVWYAEGYVPVDIKHHRVLDPGEDSILVSDPRTPTPAQRHPIDASAMRPNQGDALQLAHYHRMLEALGYASGSTLAGILGKEEVVVWYDLAAPMWTTPAKSDGVKRKKRTSLERYDFEFGFRLNIAATALAYQESADVALLVEPMSSGECPACGFREHCNVSLLSGSGDASLLPRLPYADWRVLRDHGIVKRADVAGLHYPTAMLGKDGVDVTEFLRLSGGHARSTPLEVLRPKAQKQIRLLAESSVVTVGDLVDRIDPVTASIGGWVTQRIIDARAVCGEAPVYQRPGGAGEVPRADIEIDVDMESVNEGVYLWGTHLTDRSGSGAFAEGYLAFVSWEPLDDPVEASVFLEFWSWLSEQRVRSADRGLSFRGYAWHAPAENTHLRRISRNVDPVLDAEVDALIGSDEWVDLKVVFERGWVTGESTSLKSIAPLAGYQWAVEDPGGGLAMVMYDEALGAVPARRDDVRQWILDYNQGDVEATSRIRIWLDEEGRNWPEVELN